MLYHSQAGNQLATIRFDSEKKPLSNLIPAPIFYTRLTVIQFLKKEKVKEKMRTQITVPNVVPSDAPSGAAVGPQTATQSRQLR